MARALEAHGDLPGAIERIEWLLEEHRAARAEQPGLLVLLNTQCRLYREVGDISHSIALGERALDEVRLLGLIGSEEEIRLASTLVASYWERGDWVKAELMAREVVTRAEAHGSPRSRGSAYWNASLSASSVGGVTLAIELAERAIAMLSETEDERSLARLRTDFAWILLCQHSPDLPRVGDLLGKAYAKLSEIGVDTDLAYCETELARYHLAAGRPNRRWNTPIARSSGSPAGMCWRRRGSRSSGRTSWPRWGRRPRACRPAGTPCGFCALRPSPAST